MSLKEKLRNNLNHKKMWRNSSTFPEKSLHAHKKGKSSLMCRNQQGFRNKLNLIYQERWKKKQEGDYTVTPPGPISDPFNTEGGGEKGPREGGEVQQNLTNKIRGKSDCYYAHCLMNSLQCIVQSRMVKQINLTRSSFTPSPSFKRNQMKILVITTFHQVNFIVITTFHQVNFYCNYYL